jgi:small subunit ribosomal protein S16
MAVRIRLARFGAKRKPYYRIVAADSKSRRDGRFIEQIGSYDPNFDPPVIKIARDRYDHWMSVGALPTDTVASLARRAPTAEA